MTTIHWLLYVPLLYLTHILSTHVSMFSTHLLNISVQVSPSPASLLATVALTPSSTEPSGFTNCQRSLLLFPEIDVFHSLVICQVRPIVVSRIVSPEEDTVKSSPL